MTTEDGTRPDDPAAPGDPAGSRDPAGSPDPADGRPDFGLPGADAPAQPTDTGDDLPERLGERIGSPGDGTVPGEPDLQPDVEVPDEQM
jgi:hypothetical protein